MHLTFGLATTEGNHRESQPFAAVVCAQAAGEQALAVRDVQLVAGAGTGRAD